MLRSIHHFDTSRWREPVVRFSKFAIVGGSGVLINTAVLILLYGRIHLPLLIASALAVEISVISNFVWNDRWTFGRRTWSLSRLLRFNAVSLGGLVVTTATLGALVRFAAVPYISANLVGIGLATAWNFAVNSLWTWGRPQKGA